MLNRVNKTVLVFRAIEKSHLNKEKKCHQLFMTTAFSQYSTVLWTGTCFKPNTCTVKIKEVF